MKLQQFIDEIDNLVHEWSGADAFNPRGLPRDKLEAIYDKMREHTVHDLAEAVEAQKRGSLDKRKEQDVRSRR